VLVKNAIAGINYINTYFRTGLYPLGRPEFLGREAAGVVVALRPGPESTTSLSRHLAPQCQMRRVHGNTCFQDAESPRWLVV
jgi:hypothetical protein